MPSLSPLFHQKYLTYALSVITDRALPDIRDGLKPVQRRLLYAMHKDLHLDPTKAHRKSAAIVGTTMAKYHPHGDASIYDAMVRMAQPWVCRVPLVDSHGNFGNVDGDRAAASRYTEARLSTTAQMVLDFLNVVPMTPNFDGTAQEPECLPAGIPLLPINGASGIAVGMATSIPPANPLEVLASAMRLIRDPKAPVFGTGDGMIQGPDFPGGGSLLETTSEIERIFEDPTESGSVTLRSTYHIEGKRHLIFTEIPWGVQKQRVMEKLGTLIMDGQIPQIYDAQDESSGTEIRIRITLGPKTARQRDFSNVLAFLFKKTDLQVRIRVNLVALVPAKDVLANAADTQFSLIPAKTTMRGMLLHWVEHRRTLVTSDLQEKLVRRQHQAHVEEGFCKVLERPQDLIKILVGAPSRARARDLVQVEFDITDIQVEAVLGTRLGSLNAEDRKRRVALLETHRQEIASIRVGLSDVDKVIYGQCQDSLDAMSNIYARKTRINAENRTFTYDATAFVEDEKCVVILSEAGKIRRQAKVSTPRVGKNDKLLAVLPCSILSTVVIITNLGSLWVVKVSDIEATTGTGVPIQKILAFSDGEVCLKAYVGTHPDLILISSNGKCRRVNTLDAASLKPRYTKPSKTLLKHGIAFLLDPAECDAEYLTLATHNKRALTFESKYVPVAGPSGVKAVTLTTPEDYVVGATLGTQLQVLNKTLKDLPVTSRGSIGMRYNVKARKKGPLK